MNSNIKKISIKNYIILLVIMILTFFVSLYILSWYKNYNDYKLNIPVLKDTIAEVKYQDVDAFLSERNITILYMCTVNESKCRNFEKKFKKYIVNTDLRDDVFYFNMSAYDDKGKFLESFYTKYKSKDMIKKMSDYPLIVVFSHNQIIDFLSSDQDMNITVDDVNRFLVDYVDLL